MTGDPAGQWSQLMLHMLRQKIFSRSAAGVICDSRTEAGGVCQCLRLHGKRRSGNTPDGVCELRLIVDSGPSGLTCHWPVLAVLSRLTDSLRDLNCCQLTVL